MTDAQRRRKANQPNDRQRTSVGTAMRHEPTAPGVFDGQVRVLVANGKPVTRDGAALLRWYNAHPPAESERQVAYMGTAVREREARRGA